ncbi:MAG: heavy metal translocating P-type ATPase [Parahaliea sp.]
MSQTQTKTSPLSCYHCGEPVPEGSHFTLMIGAHEQFMCCPGCRAVASLILDSGMAAFYERRSGFSERPEDQQGTSAEAWLIYDELKVSQSFCKVGENGLLEARLLVGGITCAACTWLIEHSLSRLPGVARANVNLQHSRLDLQVDTHLTPLSAIFIQLEALGYRAQPFMAQAQRDLLDNENRRSLRRLAVAGLGMMQVGMFAIGLHAGDLQGITDEYRGLMRWTSLIMTSFVVLFSARSFFETAWRNLRIGALVMDLPVALAIGLAWLASCWATLHGEGQVYFDSVVMFTFFLLLGRYLEQRARRRLQLNWYDVENSLPAAVLKKQDGQWQNSPRISIKGNDIILIPAGSTVPIDGCILQGNSSVREDSFNGEQRPRPVSIGDTVFAGTLNLEDSLEVQASGNFADTRLAALQQSVGQASRGKPRLWQLADRIAAWFVLAVLLITGLTGLIWSQIDPARAFWISLSVLVISCPCALALATPVALTSAAAALRRRGVLVHGENAIDALANSSHMIFDKTGTLTEGRLTLQHVQLLGSLGADELKRCAAALQQVSRHPVARAFEHERTACAFDNLQYRVGAGVIAHKTDDNIDGNAHRQSSSQWRMGSAHFCRELFPTLPDAPAQALYWVALVRSNEALAWFGFSDQLRPESAALRSALSRENIHCLILSGDNQVHVSEIAGELGFDEAHGGLTPQQKLAALEDLQAKGAIVTAVGDGLNDGPLLARADASFAVAEATDLARAQADLVIERGDLSAVELSWRTARAARRIVRQNMAWALAYNMSAIPLAALGLIPPWAAAIGMSSSSLLVVLNSLRLTRSISVY